MTQPLDLHVGPNKHFSAEIRLKIYRYLLLSPGRADLDPYFFKKTNDGVLSRVAEYSDLSDGDEHYELNMIDFHGFNPYGVDMGDMCDGMFNDVYLGRHGGDASGMVDYPSAMDFEQLYGPPSCSIDDKSSDGSSSFKREEAFLVKRHLSILRANRQIYNETSDLLHSELTVSVGVGDALVDTPGSAFVTPSKQVWRHTPFKGLGRKNLKGQTEYESPPMDGSMEPHVFAQFERILYDGSFDFDIDDAPSLYVDDKRNVRAEDADKFRAYLTTNGRGGTPADVAEITSSSITVTQLSTKDVIQKFVDLLSTSPFIRHLELKLMIEVKCTNPRYDISPEDPGYESLMSSSGDEKENAADLVATEMFLESGVLSPLEHLSNVRTFSLEFVTTGYGESTDLLHKKHLDIIGDLKRVVEKNWEDRNVRMKANSRCR